MHIHNTQPWEHTHHYISGHELHSERRTQYVIVITAIMMVIEITCGFMFNSMALLADGWHMSTHAGALGIAAFAYFFARKQAHNPRFTFGTGKVNSLGGFTSAIILAMIALLVAAESTFRLFTPSKINFDEATFIAVIGLAVNLFSAWLLREDHHHHDHAHEDESHHHHDHNLKAAYMHVIADAFTSILAIVALGFGKYLGWVWLDPVMGIVGSLVIANWAYGLLKQTSAVLLDHAPDDKLESDILKAIENDSDNKVTDLHIWNIAPGRLSAIIAIVTDSPKPAEHYKKLLNGFHSIVHVTVEVNKCANPNVT